jgi:hypothetical protein
MGGMERKSSAVAPIAVAVAVALLLPAIYFGSFYALLEPPPFVGGAGTIYPRYRIGGETSEVIFAPAYELYLAVIGEE